MITSNEPWRSDLIIKRTLLVSLVLHVLILATAFDLGAHLIAAAIKQHVKPRDKEIVTISSAVTIAKRPKPVPVQPAAAKTSASRISQSKTPTAKPPKPVRRNESPRCRSRSRFRNSPQRGKPRTSSLNRSSTRRRSRPGRCSIQPVRWRMLQRARPNPPSTARRASWRWRSLPLNQAQAE